jgi:hypothetical protein
MIYFFITYFFKTIELFSDNFYEFKVYKKKFNIKRQVQNENLISNICLLMQGPLIEKNNFTFETLKWYKNCNPEISIIFSTWDNQNDKIIKKIKNLGIYVIENELPKNKGIVNVNLQIISTNSGLNLAENKNLQYVLKTRSDQRIYDYKMLFVYFLNILKIFPLDDKSYMKQRLIISSLNTYQNRLYGVSDMFMFGRICDMKLYWDIPLQSENILPTKIDYNYYISYKLGEGAFVMNFFTKINFIPKWNNVDSDFFLCKYFYIVDKEDIGLFWYKYKRYDGFNYFNDENKSTFFRRAKFSNWLNSFTKFK